MSPEQGKKLINCSNDDRFIGDLHTYSTDVRRKSLFTSYITLALTQGMTYTMKNNALFCPACCKGADVISMLSAPPFINIAHVVSTALLSFECVIKTGE